MPAQAHVTLNKTYPNHSGTHLVLVVFFVVDSCLN